MAVDTEIEPHRRRGRGDRRNVAVINWLLKPAFRGAALEPGAPPMCDRLMRHIGVDIDPGHQTASKAKAASHRVVVNLVLGCRRGVEGFDPVGAERGSGHGSSSLLRLQACTATAPPQSFPSCQAEGHAMDSHLPEYELYAIRYAERDARRADHFIGGDPHDAPMPMDYFVWAAIGPERSFVIDTGFTAEVAAARGRRHLRCPAESLALVGLDRNTVADVILTHMHYDHVGTFHRFPAAQFHLQEVELHYTTGRHMRYPFLARSFEVEDVVGIVRLSFARRVRHYNGPVELAPGISLHPVGGHTPGMQFVRVHTGRGWVVLAFDVTHYYENMEAGRPFTAAFHIGEMLEAYDALRAHAPTLQHIVPGHDPLVMRRYPPTNPELDGIVVRPDAMPRE